MKKIILYGLNDERKKQISDILSQDVILKFIDKNYLEENVGSIFDDKEELSDKEIPQDDVFDNEFMLIQGFEEDKHLKDLLFAFKSKLVARPITSMRTPNNEQWTLKELLKEIFEENEYMMNNYKK